jgi:Tol biopolymer transport system component
LLLANEDDEVTIWLDLESGTYTPLALGVDTSQMAAPRAFTIAPDGSGFAFLTYDRSTEAANIFWYDMEEEAARLVRTHTAAEGELEDLQISPTGGQAVYVLHKGSRREGRSEELRLVDLDTGESRVLLSGPLGPLQPAWSPDGERIAFVRRNLDAPVKPGPHAAMPLGDVWTLEVASGELQQLTFTQAITRPPVWSPAGRHLAFVTAGGELGLVESSQPDGIWRVDTQLLQPQFTRIGFLP